MKKYLTYIIPAIAAYLATVSFWLLTEIDRETSGYYGTAIMGWNPLAIAIFVLAYILIKRFIESEVIHNKGRVILSCIFGFLLSLFGVWGELMLYQSHSVFDTKEHILTALLLPLGLSLFFIPLFSEITGFVDGVKRNFSVGNAWAGKMSQFFDKHPVGFFFILWAVMFASYLPMFLAWWPGNFNYDAGDEIADYVVEGSLSTHHPLIHIFLLGVTYSLGLKMGLASKGLQFYTLFQMLILSAAFAFLITSVRKRKPPKFVYMTVLLVTVFNPINIYFAVTSEKGIIGVALFIFAITILFNTIENEKWNLWNVLGFVLLTAAACHFRNNMVYGVVAGGIVMSFLQKGLRKKLIIFAAIVLVFICYKTSYAGLKSAMHAKDATPVRESMSVPLQCMVNAANKHGAELPDAYREELGNYIPEEYWSSYSIFISDNIKGLAIEPAIAGNKINFLKLFIKMGLKYPGDYIDSIIGLTIGYWYPFDLPYWTNGFNDLAARPVGHDLEEITIKRIVPSLEKFTTWYFVEGGRMKLPLFGWFWRGTLYTWGCLYAFGYCIYRKNKKGLSYVMIPLCYLLTCFLGPVSYLRYIYLNVALLPMMFYAMVDSKEPN